jgi:hypothetical protein
MTGRRERPLRIADDFSDLPSAKKLPEIHTHFFATPCCSRNIEMSPLCKVQTALSPLFRALEGVPDDGGGNDAQGVFAARSRGGD